MQKLLSIGLLVIFTFVIAGHFIAGEIVICSNRALVKQKIAAGSLLYQKKIVLTRKEAEQWIEGGEISYQNNRYDIVHAERQKDVVVIFVIDDKLEGNIMAGLLRNNDTIGCKTSPRPVSCFWENLKDYNPGRILSLQVTEKYYPGPGTDICKSPAVLDGYSNQIGQPPKFRMA